MLPIWIGRLSHSCSFYNWYPDLHLYALFNKIIEYTKEHPRTFDNSSNSLESLKRNILLLTKNAPHVKLSKKARFKSSKSTVSPYPLITNSPHIQSSALSSQMALPVSYEWSGCLLKQHGQPAAHFKAAQAQKRLESLCYKAAEFSPALLYTTVKGSLFSVKRR